MNIVTVSGGITSAWVADYVLKNVDRDAELIFTDTKWEHKDLYRFLDDLEKYWGKKIKRLSDGRTPEMLFYDQRILGNNRVPLCSRVLKAELLQHYLKYINNPVLWFGIDFDEQHRAARIAKIYNGLGVETRFPLVEQERFFIKEEIIETIESWGIEIPELYRSGFSHNNCSGGCVRQGQKTWMLLLKLYPEVYQERERLEETFSQFIGKKVTFLKDSTGLPLSLRDLRKETEEIIETQNLLFPEDEICSCFG